MRRGWEVELADGIVHQETKVHWSKIPINKIVRLTLRFDGREWNIVGGKNYSQKKRATVIAGVPESFQIISRSIGYYEDGYRVWYTLNESTGKMNLEVEELNGGLQLK